MWAMNGNLARYLLDDGVSAFRLAQLRSFGSWVILLAFLGAVRPELLRVERREVPALAFLGAVRPELLRVERRELPALAFLGMVGLAGVHATYFLAIEHLDVGVAV